MYLGYSFSVECVECSYPYLTTYKTLQDGHALGDYLYHLSKLFRTSYVCFITMVKPHEFETSYKCRFYK